MTHGAILFRFWVGFHYRIRRGGRKMVYRTKITDHRRRDPKCMSSLTNGWSFSNSGPLLLIKLSTHSGASRLNKLNTRGLSTSREGCYDINSAYHNCRCRCGNHWFRAWTKSIGSGQKRIVWFVGIGYKRPSRDTEVMGGLIDEGGLSDLYWCDEPNWALTVALAAGTFGALAITGLARASDDITDVEGAGSVTPGLDLRNFFRRFI